MPFPLLAMPLPLSLADLRSIEAQLRTEDCLFHPAVRDCHDAATYLGASTLHDTEFAAVLDLNVFTRVMRFASPGYDCRDDDDANVRLAAAVMAFAGASQIELEPSPARAEQAAPTGDEEVAAQLTRFRQLNDLSPQIWADIALGRRHSVLSAEMPIPQRQEPPRPMPASLRERYRQEYPYALQLGILVRRANEFQSFALFLDWMERSYRFSAPALRYGALALSPSRRGKMLKGVRGQDHVKALQGIRNAAWDMVLLREWAARVRHSQGTDRVWLLCTLDQALMRLAKDLMVVEGGPSKEEALRVAFQREWGQFDGDELYARYVEIVARIRSDPARAAFHLEERIDHRERIIEALEAEFRSLIPPISAA